MTSTWEQAVRDRATGLINAAVYRDRLGHALEFARERGEGLCVMSVAVPGDLEDLATAGARIADAIRASDTVARFGLSELGLLLPGLGRPTDAELVLARIDEAVGETALQYGSAIFPCDAEDPEVLLTMAAERRDPAA